MDKLQVKQLQRSLDESWSTNDLNTATFIQASILIGILQELKVITEILTRNENE